MPQSLSLRVRQYTASVAVDARATTALVSCPRGNVVAGWDLASGELKHVIDSTDVAGLFRLPQAQWVSSTGVGQVNRLQPGAGGLTQATFSRSTLRWDNHLTVI